MAEILGNLNEQCVNENTFSINDSCHQSEKQYHFDNLPNALEHLTESSPFAFYPLNFSQNDANIINNFQIKIDGYPEYGNIVDKDFPQGLTSFLKSLGPNGDQVCELISKVIFNIVDEFMANSGNNTHSVFFVRASSGKLEDYDFPHLDFCPTYDGIEIKSGILIALKGESTIFYDIPLEIKQEYEQEEILPPPSEPGNIDRRIIKYRHFYNVNAGYGNGAAFLSHCDGALHKAPGIYEPRLFLIALQGNQELVTVQQKRFFEQAEEQAQYARELEAKQN